MPRSGPRPYECVRRSWHSDRHRPIRGSIIQQIFRVVHENHSTGTKKNREWQEKLPMVVFKTEEIMYSKANSEAEYINLDTLWDRVNDAINTLIRKDESMEIGEFLPPCVEAALNLGCVPVRSSRSERNSNTRSYLGSRNQDPKTIDLLNLENPSNISQSLTFSETNRDVMQNYTISPPGPSFYPSPIENTTSLAPSSVYPLYYGAHFQPHIPTTNQNLSTIIVGTPVLQTTHECDLSLRLGLGSGRVKGVDLSQSSSVVGYPNKEFAFFPLNSEGEQVPNLLADVRKRKAEPLVDNNVVLEHDFNQKRQGLSIY